MIRNILLHIILLLFLFIHSLHSQDVVNGFIELNRIAPATATVISATKSIKLKKGFKASGLNASFNAKIGISNNICPSTIYTWTTNVSVTPTEDMNYVETYSYLTDDVDATRSILYIDGLGRVVQRVDMSMAPDGADWVTNYSFDSRGIQTGESLATAEGGNLGGYLIGDQTTTVYNDNGIFKQTIIEPSPLKRTIGYKGPGDDWVLSQVDISHNFNEASEVKKYQVDANGKLIKSTVDYPENSLEKTETSDEDGKTTSEYKDMYGRVVMNRKVDNVNGNVDTYFIYNDLGQLSYVIPPKAADELQSLSSAIDETNDVVANLCYVYRYDGEGNCNFKKLPGCDPISMVYDSADRLILSQDGEQKLQNQWTVNKYDALGRLVYTGVMTDTFTAAQIATINSTLVVESYVTKGSTATFYNTGYTDAFFTGKIKPLVVNYYDKVDFLKYLSQAEQDQFSKPTTSDFDGIMDEMNGVLTGSRVYVLDGLFTHYSTRVNYYNELEMVGYTVASNHVGGYDYTKNDYNLYTGKLTKTTQRHSSKFGAVVNADINEVYTYTYDNGQRLKTTTYKLNDKPAVVLANNGYDQVGRLTEKKRHSSADTEQFEYNIRSWPTKISSGNFVENIYYNVPKTTDGKKYYNGNISYLDWTYKDNTKGYEFEYTDLNQLKSAAYKHQSSAGGDGDFDESYVYDKMGNITNLTRKSGGILVDNLVLKYLNSEKSNQLRNITDGGATQNYYLRKEYIDRNLSNVTEFAFDKNGNMTKDMDRRIVTIRYNLLNLPDLIQFSNGSQIVNTYDASGKKLGSEYFTQNKIIEPVTDGQVISQHFVLNEVDQIGTIYVDNKEYSTLKGDDTQTTLTRLYNPEGYVTDLINPQYYYYRRDHLGDNREVWLANTKETKQITQYYPSGLPMVTVLSEGPGLQERKYNGKEFVEMHGLDAYDYGARLLFSDRGGSWMSVDPLAEKFYDVSPYIYCHNNPINRIDKDGRSDEDSNGTPGKKPEFDPKTNKIVGHYTTAQSSTSRSPVSEKIRPFKMTMQQQVAVAKKSQPQAEIKDENHEKYKSVVNDAMNDPIKKQCLTDPVMQTSASAILGGTAGAIAKTGVSGLTPLIYKSAQVALENPNATLTLAGSLSGFLISKISDQAQDMPSFSTGLPAFDNAFQATQSGMTFRDWYNQSFDSNTK